MARVILRAVLTVACLLCGPLRAQEGTTSLRAELALTDPVTGAGMQPGSGQMVRLVVTLTDAVTGQAPRGLPLQGWVRPVQTGNSTCDQAVRGFLTTGSVPTGSVNLNTSVLAMQSRDGSLGVIDPKLNLMSANMLSAFRPGEVPAGLAVDSAGMRLLATQSAQGTLLAFPVPGGDPVALAKGLQTPADIALTENGDLWIGALRGGRLTHLGHDGSPLGSIDMGHGRVILRDVADLPLVAFSEAGAVRLIDRKTGDTLYEDASGEALADVAAVGDTGVLSLPAGRAEAVLRYLDAPQAPITLSLGLEFARVSVSADGRFALAWTPGEGTFVLIDLARAQVVQPVALRDATLTEARIFNDAAYLLSHDGGFVGVIDLATVGLGRAAEITEVRLGVKGSRPLGDTALLVPLAPSPQLLAVDPVTQTGFVIEAMSGVNGMPPMDATRLRGGVPQKVLVVDRRFGETAPGRFSAVWAFEAGDYELVLTTGITGLSSCLTFTVEGTRQARGVLPVRMEAVAAAEPLVAGDAGRIRLMFYGPDGAVLPMPRTRIRVLGLRSGWRIDADADPDDGGGLSLAVTLPHAGAFALQPVQMPAHTGLRHGVTIEAFNPGGLP